MKSIFPLILLLMVLTVRGQDKSPQILTGAQQLDKWLPEINGLCVALFANQTSVISGSHLADSLKKLGLNLKKIFTPEHGLRGKADAGEQVGNYTDPKTGISVISLYGKKQKPTQEDLADIQYVLFDIQDVGTRFYTYISSLQKLMEACFENHKILIILDRPNPNGFYVDGPVLDSAFRSFVGMQPVPVVYGMTIGEYALMIAGEHWLSQDANRAFEQYQKDQPLLIVIPCMGYTHKSRYALPVRPSPNLPDMQAVYLYPSLCFFEGTVISLGRGTDKPFQQFGSPEFPKDLYSFTPRSVEGAKNPPLLGETCYGFDLSQENIGNGSGDRIHLKWLLEAYRLYPDKEKFFLSNKYFNLLAGNDQLIQQIKEGKTEQEIRKSWEPGLKEFKKIRKKYLLYEDFE